LLSLKNQLLKDISYNATNNFSLNYVPSKAVAKPYPLTQVEFEPTGAYSLYNWELFFHIPMLIANRLSQNQQFAEAQR